MLWVRGVPAINHRSMVLLYDRSILATHIIPHRNVMRSRSSSPAAAAAALRSGPEWQAQVLQKISPAWPEQKYHTLRVMTFCRLWSMH